MTYLNGDYYNNTLTDEISKGMIDENIIWNIGGLNKDANRTVSMFYEGERGTTGGLNAPNTYEWKKENTIDGTTFHSIGLPYSSDYGWATSGGSLGRKECFAKALTSWSDESYKSECADNDWLNNSYFWTLTPNADDIYIYFVNEVGSVSDYGGNLVYSFASTYPTIYLKKDAKILSGVGTEDSPFRLFED